MTDSRSELSALADEIAETKPYIVFHYPGPSSKGLNNAKTEMIVSALRLAASQPDREAIARAIEGIILRRVYEKRIEGYTLEMSLEQTDAILALLSVKGGGVQGSIADCGQCNEHSGRQLSVPMPRELSDCEADAALRATAVWLDVKGSQLTVNREKMKARYHALVKHFESRT